MNFFIKTSSKDPSTISAPVATTDSKIFGKLDVGYTKGAFNSFLDDFLVGQGSNLSAKVFEWKDFDSSTYLTGDKIVRRLANTIDSLYVRCCYDVSRFIELHAYLHEALMPEILRRMHEPGFPILKWNFQGQEKLLVDFSSCARRIILNTDSIVESIYMFSYFPFLSNLPDNVDIFTPSRMAKVLKNDAEKEFDFDKKEIFNGFQKLFGDFSKWDKKNRNLRNYLVHMSDIHTALYSEKGKGTAIFCCAFNDVEPIENSLRLIHFEDLSFNHQKLLEFQLKVIEWYKAF